MTNSIHLFHVFATFMTGGIQVRTCRLINSLPECFHHTIMAMDQKLEARSLIKDEIKVNYITGNMKRSSLFCTLRLAKIISSISPNLILTYNWGSIDAVLAAKICRFKKIIHMEAGFRPDEAEGCQKRRRVLYRRFLLRYVSGVIIPSLILKDIAEQIWRLPGNKIFYIPNGVDCDHFTPGKAIQKRRKLGIRDDECVIGIVAYLREVKNIGLLIRAFAGIRTRSPVHLLIIGDGPEKDSLVNLAEETGVKDSIHFIEHQKDPSKCYQMMDIFALSSKSEQMPVSVLEAMATGLPIFSTDVGDVRNMVDDENRYFIVKSGNESLYQEVLEKLVINKDKRNYLGVKNRQKCLREFRQDQMIASYQNLYKKVLFSSSSSWS